MAIADALLEEAVDLLRQAIRIDTTNPPGNETPLARLFADYLSDAGLDPVILEREQGRGNVVARLSSSNEKPPILLSAHLDVVPADPDHWSHPPFAAEVHEGRIYGRGAVDMKAMAAMNAAIVKGLATEKEQRQRDLIFAGVADEETGGEMGAGFLVAEHPDLVRAEYGLTEVGGFTLRERRGTVVPVQVAEKGVFRFQLRATGRAGHGSLPGEDNALLKLARAITEMGEPLRHRGTPESRSLIQAMGKAQGGAGGMLARLLPSPTLGPALLRLLPEEKRRSLRAMLCDLATPTMAEAGSAPNVIPGEASCLLDVRTLPGTTRQEALAMVRGRVGQGIEVIDQGGSEAGTMPSDTELFRAIERVMTEALPNCRVVPYLMPGFSDAMHYRKLGITVYGFAPVDLEPGEPFAALYHAPDERISVAGFKRGLGWLDSVVREMIT